MNKIINQCSNCKMFLPVNKWSYCDECQQIMDNLDYEYSSLSEEDSHGME